VCGGCEFLRAFNAESLVGGFGLHSSVFVAWMLSHACMHLLCDKPFALQLIPESLHVILQSARFVAQRYKVRGEPVGRIVVCRIEAFIQELQLSAEVLNVVIKVLDSCVSGMRKERSSNLTSSEKPVILCGMGERTRWLVVQQASKRSGAPGIISAQKVFPSLHSDSEQLTNDTAITITISVNLVVAMICLYYHW
jgi:hypothetical protein